jgi:hypothetical protein
VPWIFAPVYEWAGHRWGIGPVMCVLAGATVVVACALTRLCPDPDGARADARRAGAATRGGTGDGLWLVAVARCCMSAPMVVFGAYMPLALAAHGVSSGWSQIGPVVGAVVVLVTARETAGRAAVVSTRALSLAGPVLIVGAVALALAGEAFGAAGNVLLAIGVLARTMATTGNDLHSSTLNAAVGGTIRGKAVASLGADVGGLVAGLVGGAIWTLVDPEIRYEVLLVVVVALTVVGDVATRLWLRSRSRSAAPAPAGAAMG